MCNMAIPVTRVLLQWREIKFDNHKQTCSELATHFDKFMTEAISMNMTGIPETDAGFHRGLSVRGMELFTLFVKSLIKNEMVQ